MDTAAITELLWPVTIWHWLVIALVLFAIEMMAGTFDLLMIAIAALFTAAWTALAPDRLAVWEIQLTIFFVGSVVLIVLGRTVFTNLRTGGPGEPALNQRMERLMGSVGVVVADFSRGEGRVKIGDTEWMARAASGEDFPDGASVVVEGADSTIVIVRPR